MKVKVPWWLSWPAIILATIIFWPVGVLLVWRRISVDKKAAMVSGKLIIIVGWIGIFFAIIGCLASISEGFGSEDIVAIIFLLGAGLAFIYLGRIIRINAEKYKKYISIVVNQQITSIDAIASAMSTSYEAAKKDLQRMVSKGYFQGADINDETREIVLPRTQEVLYSQSSTATASQSAETHAVTCGGCGAYNKITKGFAGECEYCGSPISAKQ